MFHYYHDFNETGKGVKGVCTFQLVGAGGGGVLWFPNPKIFAGSGSGKIRIQRSGYEMNFFKYSKHW
jgi:hypothetical protein